MLRMPSSMDDEARRKHVKKTISLLSLNRCSKMVIEKLSGGERKRLTFATVLLSEPPIVLIHEPTSGKP